MTSGQVATSQTAGTTRRWTLRALKLAATVAAKLTMAAAVLAQAPEFTAVPTVFPATGNNFEQMQTVAIQVNASTAIRSITVPIGFVASPDFVVVSQTGCVIDGATANPAGSTCSVTVHFTPVAAGLRTGSLVITDASGKATAFGLAGTGYFPLVSITPSAAKIAIGLGPTGAGFSGDGAASVLATVNVPQGLAVDSFGNVYVADSGNGVVRMLDAFGNVTTVAGGGALVGAAADGGPATAAVLSNPTWLATDSAGNLYIAETGSNVIRRVAMSTDQTITTYAGSYSAGSSDGTSATTATLNGPQGLVVDPAGNLTIADAGNNLIRRVDAVKGTISTVAGGGSGGFSAGPAAATSVQLSVPMGLALDLSGNLYIADSGFHVVREVSGNTIATIAGTGTAGNTGDGGLATEAQLRTPTGLTVNPAGDLYIADSVAGIVRKLEASTGNIETVMGTAKDAGSYTAGISVATDTRMNGPTALAFDMLNNLYVSDSGNDVVRLLPGVPGYLGFAAQSVGNSSTPTTVQIANTGNVSLSILAVNGAGNTATNFTLNNSGNGNCLGEIASGTHCAMTIAFAPQATGFMAGEFDLLDYTTGNSNNTYTQPIYVSGGNRTPITISPGTLSSLFTNQSYNAVITVAGGYGAVSVQTSGTLPQGITATVSGLTITLSGTTTATGSYTFTVYATDALGENVAHSYMLVALPPVVTYSDQETVQVGDGITEIPGIQYNLTEAVTVSDGLIELPGLQYAMTEAISVSDNVNNLPGLQYSVTEAITVSDNVSAVAPKAQTITPPTIGAHTYGDAPFSVAGTSDSGLPVSVAVTSGPGTITGGQLNINGAGTVVLTYTQAGNAMYAPATPVTLNVSAAKAAARVVATSATRSFEQYNPAFAYTFSGLVHGDTTVSGTPVLTTTANLLSPAGTYPITPSIGTLSTANYTFSFTSATLTITGGAAQTITFTAIPNVPSIVVALTLTAHSSSGLPIVYTVSGPATVSGHTLTITGTGQVTVTANQPGNTTFSAATPVSRSFQVTP